MVLIVTRCQSSKVAFFARSAGGLEVVRLASKQGKEFLSRPFAVALADSIHERDKSSQNLPDDVKKFFEKHSRNYVTNELKLNKKVSEEVKKRCMMDQSGEAPETRTRGGTLVRPKYAFDSKTHKKVVLKSKAERAEERNRRKGAMYTVMKFEDEEDIHPDSNPLHWLVDEVVKFLKSTDCASSL